MQNRTAHRVTGYWQLGADATLRDVIIAVRADECAHRDMNHGFVDVIDGRKAAIPACTGFGPGAGPGTETVRG